MYFLVELAEKYLNILSRMLLFHLSTTQDFSSFSVEYNSSSFVRLYCRTLYPYQPTPFQVFARCSRVFSGNHQLLISRSYLLTELSGHIWRCLKRSANT